VVGSLDFWSSTHENEIIIAVVVLRKVYSSFSLTTPVELHAAELMI
jgi:hypothetical protein